MFFRRIMKKISIFPDKNLDEKSILNKNSYLCTKKPNQKCRPKFYIK